MLAQLILLFCGCINAVAFNVSNPEGEFEKFLLQTERGYNNATHGNATEKAFRLSVFADRLVKIIELNEREVVRAVTYSVCLALC